MTLSSAPLGDIQPIVWQDGVLALLDQTRLPGEVEWAVAPDASAVVDAIRGMKVRGAPAIGIAAAYGMAIAARSIDAQDMESFLEQLESAGAQLADARPTAVNLGWAVRRCLDEARACESPSEAQERLLTLAHEMRERDVAANRAIGANGAALLPEGAGVLTHCNTGSLATAGYGTALGVIRAAWEQGLQPRVFCTETRPWLQGARLTTWELTRLGIPATLIVDSAAALLMAGGEVGAVVVGADRIAANGDVANKIGTYMLAVLAKEHGIPFYVAAPCSTIDFDTPDGAGIVVEERSADEVTGYAGRRVAAEGVGARNPAFDVTPARLVSAVITELGVVRAPYEQGLRAQGGRPAATVAV